ncbi:MAG: NAD(P)/FAD-dependent oxidoreductase [Pseudomonadota bacterium]
MTGVASTLAVTTVSKALPSNPDVVIIGAGSAGIGAARRLMQQGRSVIVIEAANRIGGRAYTESNTFGVPYDQGCAWLQGPRSLPHLDVISELGFSKTDHKISNEAFFVNGKLSTNDEKRAFEAAQSAIYDDIWGKGDVAASTVISDMPFMPAAKTWLTMGHAVDMENLSTKDVNVYPDYEVNYLIKEGLGRVVAELGSDIPVKLNCKATAIDWTGEGVKIETSDGMISANACIVTVSTGVLASGAIRFSPELPVEKQEAIANVPMGLFSKIALQFDGERFGLKANDWLSYALSENQTGEGCYFITWPTDTELAVGMIGGDFAWDITSKGADVAIDLALETFAGLVGNDAKKHFVKGHLNDWHDNPNTLGAYAAAKPGKFEARDQLKAPLGRQVFFAGEAVAVPLAALCSGAHLSGEATADVVHAVLSVEGTCTSCDARGAAKQKLQGASE